MQQAPSYCWEERGAPGKISALLAHAVNLTRMETHPKSSSVIRTILRLGRGTPKEVVQGHSPIHREASLHTESNRGHRGQTCTSTAQETMAKQRY